MSEWVNKLYYGDCLAIMRDKLLLNSVDLIYLDPPFKSEKDYNAIYKDETGKPLPDQVEAFCDTWTLDEATERSIQQMPVLMREAGVDDYVTEFWRLWMNALRNTNPSLLAYLAYMAERLLAMKPLLRPTGSIYLHCDPEASHYIKALMDAIFGHRNFRSEIIWKRTSAHPDSKTLGAVHDVLLYYGDETRATYNVLYVDYSEEYVKKRYRHTDPDGRKYMDDNLTAKGLSGGGYDYEYKGVRKIWRAPIESMRALDMEGRLYYTSRGGIRVKRYLDEMKGVPLSDVWVDIPPINSMAKERMGYATQKPLALLERIINMSSNKGDVILDPFCGCATTIEAAHKLERRWIGIDIAIHAIKRVSAKRLDERLRLVQGTDYEIEGVPQTSEGAQDLWERDKYHFQKWAVESVDGFVTTRKSGDGGVDGRIYFPDSKSKELQSMAVEVKGGKNVGINVMRELRGVLDDDAAQLAGLIVMEPLGAQKERNFKKFMSSAGHLEVNGMLYPRLQMLTVAEILDGRRFQTPGVAARGIGQQSLEVSS